MQTPAELNARTRAKYGMLIDYQWCTGCHSCEIACQMEHGLPVGQTGIMVHDMATGPSRRVAMTGSLAILPPPTPCATPAHTGAPWANRPPACSIARRSASNSAPSMRWPRKPRSTRTTSCLPSVSKHEMPPASWVGRRRAPNHGNNWSYGRDNVNREIWCSG